MTEPEYIKWFKDKVCTICNANKICTKQSDVTTCVIYKLKEKANDKRN